MEARATWAGPCLLLLSLSSTHLCSRAAWIDKCRPNLLITESTYATTIRDSKRCRERDLLKKVHETVERGGKVLIPVFALGRAQELCILLETFWCVLGEGTHHRVMVPSLEMYPSLPAAWVHVTIILLSYGR